MQLSAALGNDLVSGDTHDSKEAPQLHFQALEFGDELVEAWRSRFPCPAGVASHTPVVGEVEDPPMTKASGIVFHLSVEELDQGAQLSPIGGLRLCS